MASSKSGFNYKEIREKSKIIYEYPFSSDTKNMTTVAKVDNVIKTVSLYLQVNHVAKGEVNKQIVDDMVSALEDDLNTSNTITQQPATYTKLYLKLYSNPYSSHNRSKHIPASPRSRTRSYFSAPTIHREQALYKIQTKIRQQSRSSS